MARTPNGTPPSYCKHPSGQACVTVRDVTGRRRVILLGPHGSAESKAEYRRVLTELEAGGGRYPVKADGRAASDVTVAELALAFWKYADSYYRLLDGSPSRELEHYDLALRPLVDLYGHTLAREFGPKALLALREALLNAKDEDTGRARLCRNVINQRLAHVKRVFRWAVAEELLPPSVYQALQAVRGLQKGRSAARETPPVGPVPDEWVDATLPFLRPQLRAMVELQRLTGMRPGEVIVMRTRDLDTSGGVWFYRPGSDRGPEGKHKTAHQGRGRAIPVGPQGQKVLKPWLRLRLEEYLFQPAESRRDWYAERRASRTSPLTPSQCARRPKAAPARAPGKHYTRHSYARAVARACLKADAEARRQAVEAGMPAAEAAGRVFVPHWHPHQLRHSCATKLRREFGLDAARTVLGHQSPAVTALYAEADMAKATEVMGKRG
jgi:integrase